MNRYFVRALVAVAATALTFGAVTDTADAGQLADLEPATQEEIDARNQFRTSEPDEDYRPYEGPGRGAWFLAPEIGADDGSDDEVLGATASPATAAGSSSVGGTGGGSALAATGVDSGIATTAAGVLFAAGAATVVASRRRVLRQRDLGQN